MTSQPDPPSSMFGELRDFNGAFDRSFGMVAFVLNRQLIDHMLRVGRELTLDDYESMLIWGVLAHQNVAHLLPPVALPTVVLDDRGRLDTAVEGRRALRLRDLVQITRLPRETVRRKLNGLAAQNWVERTPHGWLSSRARLEPTLREFTRESARRFLTAADEILRILRAAETDLATRVASTARDLDGEPPAFFGRLSMPPQVVAPTPSESPATRPKRRQRRKG